MAAEAGAQDVAQRGPVERSHFDVVDEPVDPEFVDAGRGDRVLAAGGEHAETARCDEPVQAVAGCGVDQVGVVDADDRAFGRGAVQGGRLDGLQAFGERSETLGPRAAVPARPADGQDRPALVGRSLQCGGQEQTFAHTGATDQNRSAASPQGAFDGVEFGISCSYWPVENNIC